MKPLEEQADAGSITSLPVSSFMSRDVISVAPGATIASAIETFRANSISVAPVASGTQLLGIISEHDLLLLAGAKDLGSPIEYRADVITILPSATLKDALIIFYKHHIRRLPVVEATGRMVGIISRMDILSRIVDSAKPQGTV